MDPNLQYQLNGLIIFFIVVLSIGYGVFKIIAWGQIGKKCGYSPWVALIFLIPIVGTIFFFIMAFKKEPIGFLASGAKQIEETNKKTEAMAKELADMKSQLESYGIAKRKDTGSEKTIPAFTRDESEEKEEPE